jgi:hypothetical protein
MNDLQFAGRYQCLPITCSGRLISLQNEHPIYAAVTKEHVPKDLIGITINGVFYVVFAKGLSMGQV